MKKLFWLVASFSLAACGAAWEHVDPATLPTPEALPEFGWVVLHDETAVAFHPDDKTGDPIADETVHMRVRILRDAGRSLAHIAVPYSSDFSTVLAFRARTVSPSGEIKEFGRSDAFERPSYASWILYESRRSLELDVKPDVPGTVVEWEYTVRHRKVRLFDFGQGFGSKVPSRLVRFSVTTPPQWEVEWVAREQDTVFDWQPSHHSLSDESTRFTWERRNVRGYPDESMGPSLCRRLPRVDVRLRRWTEGKQVVDAFRNQAELSTWLHELTRPSLTRTPAMRAIVSEALEGIGDDPEAKARRLYAWVRDHVQYCAIEIGDGAWRPHASDEVEKLRYGDCKDKANLLRALLDLAGVPSRLAAIHSSDDGVAPCSKLPTLSNFNHMVLIVDLARGPVVVDPTSRTCAFGELPVGDQEAELLPVAATGAKLERAPSSAPEDNSRQTEVELTLQPNGNASGQFHIVGSGHFAEALRHELLTNGGRDRDKAVADWIDVNRTNTSGLELVRAKPTETPSTVEVRGRLEVAEVLGGNDRRMMRLSDLVDTWVPQLTERERQQPLLFRHRMQKVQRIRLTLPEGARISAVPEPVRLESPLGRYLIKWVIDRGALKVEREFQLRERSIEPKRYAEARKFFDNVLEAESRPVVIQWEGR